MKYKLILAACVGFLPTMVSGQNPQVKDCHTLEAAGNFIEPDEVLADGLVCKIVKAKVAVSTAAQASKKDADRRAKLALLGIIEPEDVNLQEPHAKPDSGPAAITSEAPVKSAPGGTAVSESSAAPQNAALDVNHVPSVAEVARAYQRTSRRQPEDQVVAGPPATATPVLKSEDRSASAAPGLPGVPAQRSNTPAQVSADKPAAAKEPKTGATSVASVSAALAAKTPPMETEPSPAVKPGLSPEPVAPVPATTGVFQPEMRTGPSDSRDKPSTVDKPEVRPAIPEPEPDSASERPPEVKLGVFEAPKESASEAKPQMSVDPFGAPPEDFAIHEPRPGCTRIVSLGSMERDRLVLATPDWAMKWLEKNQKRFPGVCFADSPLAGVLNYLIVFFTPAPPALQASPAAKALVSASAPSGSPGGTFTTSFGFTWHYAYDNAPTTTVTTALTENVPHSQPVQPLYATAYNEQGIPISQHWPAQAKGYEKENSGGHGRKRAAEPAAVRIMGDLLSEMMTDVVAQ